MEFLFPSNAGTYEYEYLVAVKAPGGRNQRLYRGVVYSESKDESFIREKVLKIVSRKHGYNLRDEYACVILLADEDDD